MQIRPTREYGKALAKKAASSDFNPIAYINEPRWHDSRLGLERIAQLLELLGRPQDSLRFVHVAGTNGKGSTCAYLASILQEAGYRTGLFTSPYIERFEERIRVNGKDIPYSDLTAATLDARCAAENMEDHPTEFELMCAVAMLHFARTECDMVVLEVGLGGRYDATNVIESPEACVITKIGIDHTNVLGKSIAEIASEKAGIVKPECLIASCPQDEDALKVIREAAQANNAQLQISDLSRLSVEPLQLKANEQGSPRMPVRRFTYCGNDYSTGLLAAYQPQNAALAIDAATMLRGRGWDIPERAIEKGIENAVWPGRFEVMETTPMFIVDGSHNDMGACALASSLQELLPDKRLILMIGVLADKDYNSILEKMVPLGTEFVAITPPNPRALPAEQLALKIQTLLQRSMRTDAHVITAESIYDGVQTATALAKDDGCVCAFGSLYSIGAIKGSLQSLQIAPSTNHPEQTPS